MSEEIINNIEEQDKLVRVSFIKGILNKLYNWLPFRQNPNSSIVQTEADGTTTNEVNNPNEVALGKYNLSDIDTVFSIGIGEEGNRKNAIKINKNGEIFIITDLKTNNVESLQSKLEESNVVFCNTYDEMILYLNTGKKIGTFLYLLEDSTYEEVLYTKGLYLVALNSLGGKQKLLNIGTSIENKLENYYTKEEVRVLINNIQAGNIDLTNYYTISQVDLKIKDLNDRLVIVENWKETPIDDDVLKEILK